MGRTTLKVIKTSSTLEEVKFEIPIRYPNGHAEQVTEYIILKVKRGVLGSKKNWRIIRIYMMQERMRQSSE